MPRKSQSTITEEEWKATLDPSPRFTILDESGGVISWTALEVAESAGRASQEKFDEARRTQIERARERGKPVDAEPVLPYSF